MKYFNCKTKMNFEEEVIKVFEKEFNNNIVEKFISVILSDQKLIAEFVTKLFGYNHPNRRFEIAKHCMKDFQLYINQSIRYSVTETKEVIKEQIEEVVSKKYTQEYVAQLCSEMLVNEFEKRYAEIAHKESQKIAEKMWNK